MRNKRSARAALLACAGFAALGLVAGVSPAAAKTKKKTRTVSTCVNAAAPILDRLANSVSVNVPVPKIHGKRQGGTVTAFQSVGVRIRHTFVGDLDLVLVSPAGKAVPLATERDSTHDDYGSGPADCTGQLVQFGDTFPTPISSIDSLPVGNTPPITGSFSPEQPLSGFLGGPARGLWTLVVHDCCNQDQGSIDAFSLQFTFKYKVPAKKKKGGK
jgi:subtilisin-like proprotein convertase family protein